jgi:hypothetical protein
MNKMMDQVEVDELDNYYERALHYCPPISNKKKIQLQEDEIYDK